MDSIEKLFHQSSQIKCKMYHKKLYRYFRHIDNLEVFNINRPDRCKLNQVEHIYDAIDGSQNGVPYSKHMVNINQPITTICVT